MSDVSTEHARGLALKYAMFACLVGTLVFAGGCKKAKLSTVTESEDRARPSPGSPKLEEGSTLLSPETSVLHSHSLSTSSTVSETLFARLDASDTNLRFVNRLDPSHPMRYLYHSGTSCGGVAIGDVDGDNRPDIFLLSGPDENKLFRQTGRLRFEDASERAGFTGGNKWSSGAAMIDIENDGDLDIFVCNYDAPNELFVNDGEGRFVDQAAAWGVDIVDSSLMPAFADFDLDGDLDFYLLTNRYYDPEGLPKVVRDYVTTERGKVEVRDDKKKYWRIQFTNDGANWAIGPRGAPDRLFRNDGDRFTEITAEAGIAGLGDGLSATWWDFDSDGYPDLYVGNDFDAPDHLYRNNGDGTFTDVIKETVPHTSWFSMGADVGDINNDGLFDFLSADMSATSHFMQKTTMGAMGRKRRFLETAEPRQYMRNALYLNTGTPRFMEIAYLAGLADTNWTWSVKLADFDNDGRSDVYVTNGSARNTTDSDVVVDRIQQAGKSMWDAYRDKEPRAEQNLAFRNDGGLQFSDVSKAWGLAHTGVSYAAAHSDLDRDGDLDLVVVNLKEPVDIYENCSTVPNRIVVQLQGERSNRRGIGAIVEVKTESGTQTKLIKSNSGFMASDESLAHFGLGTDDEIQSLVVRWPSGAVQSFEDLPVNQLHVVSEAGPQQTRLAPATSASPLFVSSDVLQGLRHVEREFDDYRLQPLLPNKLSQLGPGIAWSDVDGDGDDDFFFAGAAGSRGRLIRNDGNDVFVESAKNQRVFRQDAACEDMGALFLDVDLDGDLDLYVASGGVEARLQRELEDRVYLNNGSGVFSKAPDETLPRSRVSSGVVVGADYDRDGDVDLFVGGRLIPSQYPLSPRSAVLRNEGGRFVDVTDEVAPAVARSGLVTGAVWSDANDDGWVDLLVTHEWGPVKLFENRRGTLVDKTQSAGLAERLGWWNGIAPGDLNEDGHIDYVVTNFGLNTKYHATPKKPALLYYGDFQQNGSLTLVEAEFEEDHLYPVRGKSCSTAAMPFLSRKFTTYKAFALAELSDIYTPRCLDDAHRFTANMLESGVYLNLGDGSFRFQPLPRLAQAAPAFGVVVIDVDFDGHQDVIIAQNFFSPQPETGRMDGGLSLLLRGDGAGNLAPVWPGESGLSIPGDAKSVTMTDFNADGRADLLIGVNDDAALTYRSVANGLAKPLAVKLQGRVGNPASLGARITLTFADGRLQTKEIYGGEGYLSQSAGIAFFSIREDSLLTKAIVRWPSGVKTHHEIGSAGTLTLDQPH